MGVTGAVEAEISPAVCQSVEARDQIASNSLRVDEIHQTKTTTPFLLGIVEINANDLVGADHAGALDNIKTNGPETEHHYAGTRRYLCGIYYRADAGRDAPANVTDLVEWRVLADFSDSNFGQYGIIRKCGAPHEVVD